MLTLIGTAAAVILVLLAIWQIFLQRLTLEGVSPKLLVTIDYDFRNEPLEVRNIEGQGAYAVRLDRFATDLNLEGKTERFYCTFEPINHLAVGQSARIEGVLEDPSGKHTISRMVLDALHARSGFGTGLVLRLHYRDGGRMRYVVHVQMPSTIFMGAHLDQPTCSPPVRLTWLNAAVETVRWTLLVAYTLTKIRHERRTSPHQGKK